MNSSAKPTQKPELKGFARVAVYIFFVMFAITMVSVLVLFVQQTQVKPPEPDDTLNALLEEHGVKNDVSIAIWRFLERDLTHNIYQNLPADQTMNTPFAMGQTQDLLIALVVGALVDRGVLSYEDPLSKHLAELPEPLHPVTLEALLSHTSGISQGTGSLDAFLQLESVDVSRTDTYAPLNYALLWQVIEAAGDQSVPEWVNTLIVEPLELAQTSYQADAEPAGFYTSLEDMGKLMWALNSNRIVKMKTLVRAFLPLETAQGRRSLYGHGWEIGPYFGIRMMRIDDATAQNVAFARFSLYGLLIAVHTDLPPEKLHAGVLTEKIARIYLEREMPQFGRPPQGYHEGIAAPASQMVEP